jgi:hypothetical protein
MSDRKLAKAVQALIRQIWRLHRSITKALVTWLLRTALIVNRRNRFSTSGFVLPTTVLLVLVVALTAGALTYRAFNTSTRSIAETQNRIIYNAATPAVDRARAKLEYLFDANKDTRLTSGVPAEELIVSMLLNVSGPDSNIRGRSAGQLLAPSGQDPYVLPGETRIDINGDNKVDNAWRYRADTDGNGTDDATVVYSIILSTPPSIGSGASEVKGDRRLVGLTDLEKSTGKVGGTGAVIEGSSSGGRVMSYSRGGPLSNSSVSGCTTSGASGGSSVERGWYPDNSNSSILRKNFQVDAFVVPDSAVTPGGSNNFTTLEFQQDRILNRGNKWGAWFRNDLEIFPGPQFNWNGAMHTEGSLIIGGTSFNAYLISSPNSCLYNPASSSEITVTDTTDPDTNQPFKGLIVSGKVNDNSVGGSSVIYLPTPTPTTSEKTLNTGSMWANTGSSFPITLDPQPLFLRSGYQSRSTSDSTNQTFYKTNQTFGERFRSNAERAPYVDDTYRADNRYGPKVKYNDDPTNGRIPPGTTLGSLIPAANTLLVNPAPAAGADSSSVGLDGYWERRAQNQGLRVLVGQRLELGNTSGWVAPKDRPGTEQKPTDNPTSSSGDGSFQLRKTDYAPVTDASQADPYTSDDEGDPLYPPYGTDVSPGDSRDHEAIQRRALRDNIPAVQSTAVYHAAVNKDYPVACLASTAHPGSPFTLRQSINFVPTFFIDSTDGGSSIPATPANTTTDTVLLTDFFNGRGTNGWEFEPPRSNATNFATDMDNPDSELRIALQNLANFAGDHVSDTQTGAFPPTQEAGQIHPDPDVTMWGNYSNLRRTLVQLTGGTAYNDLSPADKTYLQTAACTLGMLAYNIDRVQRFDPRNYQNDAKARPGQPAQLLEALATDLYSLMNGKVDEAAGDYEVLPKSQLSTYDYSNSGSGNSAYNPRDYDRVPAEAFLGKLREKYLASSGSPAFNDPKLRMAELIFSYFQIRRDRTYGFRASPAANTWNYNPYVTDLPSSTASNGKTNLWSSACDPNVFALSSTTYGRLTGKLGAQATNGTVFLPTLERTIPAYRLALSRLCGTVIPSGAERVGAGDTGFPVRNGGATESTPQQPTGVLSTFFPKGSSFLQGAKPTQSPAAFRSTPTPASPLASGVYTQELYLRATVAPKWPSLYYLFPEFDHNHDGTVVGSGLTLTGGLIDVDNDGIGAADTTPGDDVDQRQPKGNLSVPGTPASPLLAAFQPWAEPYITDAYISNTLNPSSVTYRVVDSISPAMVDSAQPQNQTYTTDVDITYKELGASFSYKYRTFYNPLDDRPVYRVAVQPRKLPSGFTNPFPLQGNSEWELPVATLPTGTLPAQNTPPNRIVVPNGDRPTSGVTAITPFLDRVIFNGREWLPSRVLDVDLGMLRRTSPRAAIQVTGNTENAPNDVWLPVSGIVYAFREDAVREDATIRPASGTYTNASNPSAQTDPPLQAAYSTGASANAEPKLSAKAVDYVPDPNRRPNGFRLRNGSVLRRHPSRNISDQDNIRGLSFFTDNPVYIMGDFNLHQDGADDDGNGTRLEEFEQKLPSTGPYNETQFYTDRVDRDTDFAQATTDRWRPTEILADAISIISDDLCDGSVIDTFMTANKTSPTLSQALYSGRITTDSGANFPNGYYPYRQTPGDSGGADVYDNTASGVYGPGCSTTNRTTFLNQNRPNVAPPSNWSWLRENPFDIFSSVKISRNGQGLLQPPLPSGTTSPTPTAPPSPTEPSKLRMAGLYNAAPTNGDYYPAVKDNTNGGRSVPNARNTRVNTIVVSGLVPSRINQSYGGMHNFPRFLETWSNLWFSGSFLQLNFSNYATAPFDLDAVEPGANPQSEEIIPYYGPPARLWGYDVALQLAPAGPAAARFVTANKDRNEFYNEPAANDPYIRNLCQAVKASPPAGVNLASLNCPT